MCRCVVDVCGWVGGWLTRMWVGGCVMCVGGWFVGGGGWVDG